MGGSFEYEAGVNIETITLLGAEKKSHNAKGAEVEYDDENKKLVMHVDVPLTKDWKM